MCRGKATCTELGRREAWSAHAPLPPPAWIRREFPRVQRAFAAAAAGVIASARAELAAFPDNAVREWCVEHGQLSGRFRHRALGKPPAPGAASASGPRQPSRSLQREVLTRDRYQCRYCGLPVVERALFVVLGAVVGAEVFPTERENARRHGARLVFGAQVDHVMPYSLGGTTTRENLVTACWACNFGKRNYHLAQLALDDPRERPPSDTPFDGFASLNRALLEAGKR